MILKFVLPIFLYVTATSAFQGASSNIRWKIPSRRSVARHSSSSSNAEVEALLAAAAKAREEASRLSEQLGRTTPAAATATASEPATSMSEIQSLLPTLLTDDLEQQTAQWQAWGETKSLAAFGSANLRTYPVSLSMLEQRTGCTAATLGLTESDVSLDDFKYATLYVTGGSTLAAWASLAFLPENVGATFCYLFALVPIVFLGVGSTAPGFIAELLVAGKDRPTDTLERQCRHEAAHFCCGYWSGLPIARYSVEAGAPPQVEFDVATTGSGYSATHVAALTITAMAGLAAEAAHFGAARGAAQDLLDLENQVFRKSREFIGAAAAQDLTRWGVLAASLLLKQNAVAYEAVVQAFARQASVEECVALLEQYAKK